LTNTISKPVQLPQSSAIAAFQKGSEQTNDSFAVLMSRTAALKQKLAAPTLQSVSENKASVLSSTTASTAAAPAATGSLASLTGFSAESKSLQATLQRLQALQTGTR
jgi:hypothetical protein